MAFECFCGNEIDPDRAALGYDLCLECGQEVAEKEMEEKVQRIAPAFNKGPYQYITPRTDLKSIGKKV